MRFVALGKVKSGRTLGPIRRHKTNRASASYGHMRRQWRLMASDGGIGARGERGARVWCRAQSRARRGPSATIRQRASRVALGGATGGGRRRQPSVRAMPRSKGAKEQGLRKRKQRDYGQGQSERNVR